jgi:hypothetical protein
LFKPNRQHNEPELFSVKNNLPKNLQKLYEKSWGKSFFENIFTKIDENIFSVLFSANYSRPNTPINIYVSLEILKETFGLSDSQLLERFHFDNMFLFAMGINNVGDITISDRTFYYMRSRVASYEYDTGINLFQLIFEKISDCFITEFKIDKNIKRIDSTLIGSNIRRLNRIKLFVEVLKKFINDLNKKQLKKLTKKLKKYQNIQTENYVYKMENEEAKIKIKEIAEDLYRIKWIYENNAEVKALESYQMLERVVNEHLNIEDKQKKQVSLKDKKELSSNSLQSPHDSDATYREKGSQARQGYSATLAETCNPENKLQIITDVIVEPNNVDDSKILEGNFDQILDDDTNELVGDGAYLNDGVKEKSDLDNKTIITTAIRGRKPSENKLKTTDFQIEDNTIICCPNGKCPFKQEVKDGKIIAYFSHESCAGCELNCIIRKNKRKPHVLQIDESRLASDRHRRKFNEKEYLGKCRLRPAIEGTMFQLKLFLRNGKSKFRTLLKVKNRVILRSIAINFNRVRKYLADLVLDSGQTARVN